MRPLTVGLVDDHPLMLEGVAKLFEGTDDFVVVAKGSTAGDALRIKERISPDIMVVDLMMPGDIFELFQRW